MKDKWGKMVQLAGMFKRLSETNQNDFGLEEHFWARPSSSKVGTELSSKVGTEQMEGVSR